VRARSAWCGSAAVVLRKAKVSPEPVVYSEAPGVKRRQRIRPCNGVVGQGGVGQCVCVVGVCGRVGRR